MMTSSAKVSRLFVSIVVLLLGGCAADSSVDPLPTPIDAQCNGVATPIRNLAPFESVVLSGVSARCFVLAGGDREYLVMPQLAGSTLPYGGYGFRLGDPSPSTTTRAIDAQPAPTLSASDLFGNRTQSPDAQTRIDALMRNMEQNAARLGQASNAQTRLSVRSVPVAVDTVRTFSVLNSLAEVPSYTPVAARLRYAGSRVLIFVDTVATAALSDGDLETMGAVYDASLVPAVTSAFGTGSDIDGNGRVLFLLTPTVNALVSASACQNSGFVRGFFYSHDLASTAATSNRGEIVYGYVPDPTQRWSCAHTKAEVLSSLPPTFIHELQHLVSFGEHVVKRGGIAEDVWLNEGLSHLAEEMGSLVFEARFPAPAGRVNPAQIFPDSAAPYITPNVLYSYRYLFSSGIYSITRCAPGSFCSLSERGGIWLFLRWLADQHGATLTRQLVETNRTGVENVEAATGRSAAALLGGFAVAVSADSVVGQARTAAPSTSRFSSRNLRRLYKGIFDLYGIAGGVGRPFPIEPLTLNPGTVVTGTMRPGTFLTYRLRIASGRPSVVLQLTASDGTGFTADAGAQVSVLRLP